MNRPKRKKLYYVPGLISLTILPILFICLARTAITKTEIKAIPLFLADTNFTVIQNGGYLKFNGQSPPVRNYIDINYTNNDINNKKKLEFAQAVVRKILAERDTVNGLHFQFNDSSHYETFVKTVDVLRLESARTYMPFDNSLWFYYFPVDTTKQSFNDSILLDDSDAIKPKIAWWTKAKSYIQQTWSNSWQIILTFSGFMFSIVIFRKRNNDR